MCKILAIDSNKAKFKMSTLKRKMQKADSVSLFFPITVRRFHSSLFVSISSNPAFQPRLNYAIVNLPCFVCYVICDFCVYNLFLNPFLRPLFHLLLYAVKCCMFSQEQIY